MSRFESFQNIQVFNENDEPLYEQIFINDCIVNFGNGFINNWYSQEENKDDCPAVSCLDGHIEYWKEGRLNNINDNLAVISTDGMESWINGELKDKIKYDEEKDGKLIYESKEELEKIYMEKGNRAEIAFAKYLNKNKVPYIHFERPTREIYSDVLKNKKIKSPDYLIFIDKKPFFIEVKTTGCYSIEKRELRKLNNLRDEFSIDVIFAVTDINKEEYNDFYFTTLNNLNNYVEIIKNDKDTSKRFYYFYYYSKQLFEDKLIPNDIDNDKLRKIYSDEGPNDKYHYSDFLRKYFMDNNYKIKDGNARAR